MSLLHQASAIPACSPSYFKGPFIFYNREYFIIAFHTTPEAIRAALPEPIQPVGDNIVLYEFMNMPDSPGLGSYSESGILIPGIFEGRQVNYTAQMYLDCEPAIYAGREIWGFPKKRGHPTLKAEEDTLVGKLAINGIQVALGTMPYKAEPILAKHDRDPAKIDLVYHKLTKPQFNLKIIPSVDGTDEIRQLIEYQAQVISIHEAWKGPARLHLVPHSEADVAAFPILDVVGATHMIADIILPYGKVVYDYMAIKRDSFAGKRVIDGSPVLLAPSIPMTGPSYNRTKEHVFYNREHFIVTARTTLEAIRNAVPAPLEPVDDTVEFSFMEMKDSPGFGSYTETSVRIPCRFNGEVVSFVNQVYSDSSASQYGGRELWGLPMKRGVTSVAPREDTLVATLFYGEQQVALATMPFKSEPIVAKHLEGCVECKAAEEALLKRMETRRVSLKIMPDVDGSTASRQLVSYRPRTIKLREAWKGPARLHLVPHVNAPLADFPIKEVLGAIYLCCDMVLPLGEIVHVYDK